MVEQGVKPHSIPAESQPAVAPSKTAEEAVKVRSSIVFVCSLGPSLDIVWIAEFPSVLVHWQWDRFWPIESLGFRIPEGRPAPGRLFHFPDFFIFRS